MRLRLDAEGRAKAKALLAAFEESTEFPLFFEDDPHWNERGADQAARTAFAELVARGPLPCPPPAAP